MYVTTSDKTRNQFESNLTRVRIPPSPPMRLCPRKTKPQGKFLAAFIFMINRTTNF